MNVHAVDWLIVAAFFAVFLALAIYINSLCRGVSDYLVSARKVRMWLGIGAGIAGEIGLVSIAAMCEQAYLRGFSFTLIIILSTAITLPLFGVFGFGIERFRASKAISVPQYLEMRYSKSLRIFTGISNCFAGVLQMCVFPILGAMFLRVLMGAPESVHWGPIELRTTTLIVAALLGCNILFTYFGGFVTLTVTNFFMMILIMVAITWLLMYLIASIGLQQIWTSLETHRGVSAFYAFAEGSYGFIWFAWLMLMTILLQFSYGPYLQKYASMDKPKTVSRSYLFGSIFGNGRTFLVFGIGVVALAAMGPTMPAGVGADESTWSKIATPYYLARVIPPALMGVWLACLIFSDISQTDQYLMSWATSIVNDCILPFRASKPTPEAHISLVRKTIAALCALFFLIALVFRPTLPIWEFLWLLANIIAGTGIAVLFGMYWPRANTAGAFAAVLINIILPLADIAGRYVYVVKWPGAKYPFAPETTGFFSYALGMVLLILVSLATKDERKYWDLGKVAREMNQTSEGPPPAPTQPGERSAPPAGEGVPA
jgi:SSS family solute:Na+ symporter